LREARVRRGLTIKGVEDATKIRGKYLEALEEDDFEVLPGSTCVKGFLRTYAIFLKLDADALVDAYKSGFEPRAEEPALIRAEVTNQRRGHTSVERKKKRVRRHQRGYALTAVLAIIVVALLAWFGTSRGEDPASINAGNISTSTTSTALPLVGEGGSSTTGTTGTGDMSSTTSTSGSDEATVSSSAQATTVTDTGNGGNGQVKIVVAVTKETCWLVVREDGENGAEVYAGTLSAGGQQTFEGAKRYWMNVGQPDSITVSVGGKSYTLALPAGAFVVTETGVERSE
jgi:cytoskeletal protein RodZ